MKMADNTVCVLIRTETQLKTEGWRWEGELQQETAIF